MARLRVQPFEDGQSQQVERLVGLTDLLVVDGPNGPLLLATTRGDGWVSAFDLRAGTAALLDDWQIDDKLLQLESTDLAILSGGGADADQVLLAGLAGRQMTALELSGNGQSSLFGASETHRASGFDMSQVTNLAIEGHLALTGIRGGGLKMLSFADNGGAQARDVGGEMRNADVSAVSALRIADTVYGFAAFGREDAISSFRLNDTGTASHLQTLKAQSGLSALADPEALHAVEIDGKPYLIVAGSGTGALSVFSVGGDGKMALTDQLRDDRDTRFADVSHLATIEMGGRVFVAAAGSDSGIGLLTLLPGGRLHHLDSVAASIEVPLRGLKDIALAEVNGGLQIWAATEGAPHLVRFDATGFDIGVTDQAAAAGEALNGSAADDVLAGADGADSLNGGLGDDILIDGGGIDRMTGGAGQDIFILSPDMQRDVVTDFERDLDWLDLTGLPGLWDPGEMTVLSRGWGAELRYHDEITEIRSSDGKRLGRDDILPRLIQEDRLDLASGLGHIIGSDEFDYFLGGDEAEFYSAGDWGDHLFGEGGDDTLIGGRGNDRLSGGYDQDLLQGGPGNDRITGDAGFDTIFGDAGNDFLNGGGQADEIHGGDGNDRVLGEDGYDWIYGDAGHDILLGGDRPDRLYGGTGDDWLSGGVNVGLTVDGLFGEGGHDTLMGDGGFDHLDGGAGNDLLDGGRQADNLYGRTGDDTLAGGQGLDRLFGGAGDDQLHGGEGPDGLYGQAGNDMLNGGDGADRLFGGTGDDVLEAEAGDDWLHGGAGFDTITGGAGNDTITGDFNADRFIFEAGHGQDRIDDFEADNQYERLDLSGISAIRHLSDLFDDHLSQDGNDAVIDTGGGNSITLTGITLDALDATDFIF